MKERGWPNMLGEGATPTCELPAPATLAADLPVCSHSPINAGSMTASQSTAETVTHIHPPSPPEERSPSPGDRAIDFASATDEAPSELAVGTLVESAGEPVEERAEQERPVRKKLEEQLEALKRKEFELRRALAIADHPELAEAVRVIEGRAFQISRVEAKLAQGLTKSEERRRDTIEKKLGSLRDKRAELDAQIGVLESELLALGAERATTFGSERLQALEQLLIALSTHQAALDAAGMEASSLVPELARWLPEIEVLAEQLAAARPSA
jgi:hypothetical protein